MPESVDPSDGAVEAFTIAQARERGIPRGQLRGPAYTRPFHGVRVPSGVDLLPLHSSALALAPRLAEGQFFSHETALGEHGAPMPEWPYRPGLHVSAYRPAREPRTRGVVGHRLQLRTPAFTLVGDLPVEHPVRAWRQVGRLWQFGDLVAAADFLIFRSLARADDLREEVRAMGDVRGGILMRALREVRFGVRSPRETRLRLLLNSAGLPEPEVAWNIFDDRGTFIAECDLAYPRYRVAVEYDGRVHAEDAAQFARDADRWAASGASGGIISGYSRITWMAAVVQRSRLHATR